MQSIKYEVFNKRPLASGSIKSAYVVDDDTHVILCPKVYNKNYNDFDTKIIKEYDMLCYLESVGLPIIKDTQVVKATGPFGASKALLQKYIKGATLYKPYGMGPMKLSDENLVTLASIIDILETMQIYICDLQILVNETELYIIDPSNIYNMGTRFYIGHHPKNKSYSEYLVAYNNQLRVLKTIIDFNSKI